MTPTRNDVAQAVLPPEQFEHTKGDDYETQD